MKAKLAKALAVSFVAVHNAAVRGAAWLKRELIVIELWAKSIAAVALSGGFVALQDLYQHKSFELTAAHLVELKAKFISGAFIGLVMYWAKSPFGKSNQGQK